MDGLDELQRTISDLSDPIALMRRMVDQALVLIPAADGAVVELAHDGWLTYVCAGGTLAGHEGTRLRCEHSLSGLAVRTGKTLCCEDATTDSRVDSKACRAVGAVSMVCVPLRRGGEAVGALKVSAGRPRAFTAADAAKLASLAEFISVAIGAVTDIARIVGQFADRAQSAGLADHEGDADTGAGGAGDGVGEFVVNVLRPGALAEMAVRRRIERLLAERDLTLVGQPIVELGCGGLVGVEALARFPGPPHQPPDVWFAEAEAVGLGVQLQLAAVEKALELIDELAPEVFLAINVGPDAIAEPALRELLRSAACERVVLELTEHLKVDDYRQLNSVLQRIRAAGVRLAIDDTGAGFASLGNIVNLAPDLIKLDCQFTRGIDLDPVRRALARALVSFAEDTGAQVIAEGIETAGELQTVRELGIPYGQGYLIARPAPIEQLPTSFQHLAGSSAHLAKPLPR